MMPLSIRPPPPDTEYFKRKSAAIPEIEL